jgi:flavin-binding protein dodecin
MANGNSVDTTAARALAEAATQMADEIDVLRTRLAQARGVVEAARVTVCAWRTDYRSPLRLDALADALDALRQSGG